MGEAVAVLVEETEKGGMMFRKKVFVSLVVALFLAVGASLLPANVSPVVAEETVLCGNGDEPKYGFAHSIEQPHWTRNWEDYFTSSSTVAEIDQVLDGLYYDNIVETVVFFMPADQVGIRTNCAVHYLRYMKMGRVDGPRKDNGFSLLFVVEPDGRIDVHYGVGLGLPAMTATKLSPLNRVGEDTYKETGSYDEAALAVVRGLDEYARSLYDPISDAEYERLLQDAPGAPPATSEGSSGGRPFWQTLLLTCIIVFAIIVIGVLVIMFLSWAFKNTSPGSWTSSTSSSSWTPSSSSGSRSRSSRRSSSRRSSNSRSSGSRSRSGRGSGRSGRGN